MLPYANNDMTFSLSLTDAQAEAYQKAYYVISRADTDNPGSLIFVYMGNNVTLTDDNTLTANFDGNIIYMENSSTGQLYEVMYTERESTDTYSRYLLSSILFNSDIQGDDAEYVYFVMETSADNPEGILLGAYPMDNLIMSGVELNTAFPDRHEVNIYDYENIAFGSISHEFTSDEDLTNFNESDWSDLKLLYNDFPISDGFSTTVGELMPDIPYYGMFIIEDAQGNRHCSNLVQIQ